MTLILFYFILFVYIHLIKNYFLNNSFSFPSLTPAFIMTWISLCTLQSHSNEKIFALPSRGTHYILLLKSYVFLVLFHILNNYFSCIRVLIPFLCGYFIAIMNYRKDIHSTKIFILLLILSLNLIPEIRWTKINKS